MNIYDIARLAGVSIATVSRVVNDSPKVSDRTKARVHEIMEQYHYTPNVFARGLGLNSMKTVGIICPDVADTYMARAVSYLEKNLRGYGYDCILYCSGYDTEDKQQAIELILKKKIDALILVGSNYVDEGLDFFPQESEPIPVFLVNGHVADERVYCVMADDYQAVYDVTDELLFEGRRRILFLANADTFSARRKQAGYEAALAEHQVEADPRLLLFSENEVGATRDLLLRQRDLDFDSVVASEDTLAIGALKYARARGLAALAEHQVEADPRLLLFSENEVGATRDLLLRQRDLDFDSVVASEDTLAIGALKYARARGLRVPEELAIIGYNNSQTAICCEPELSSVDNRVEALCRTAIDSLMAVLNGEKVEQKQVLRCHLIRRGTTDF